MAGKQLEIYGTDELPFRMTPGWIGTYLQNPIKLSLNPESNAGREYICIFNGHDAFTDGC